MKFLLGGEKLAYKFKVQFREVNSKNCLEFKETKRENHVRPETQLPGWIFIKQIDTMIL